MFNWFDKLLIKIAKKILNKYAPKGEFIAYINKQEEKILKELGGYGKPVNETGIKSFWGNPFKAAKKIVTKVLTAPVKIISKALSWIAPKPPEIPDFGTTDFDDFETGILLNKQSNDANIPVIYGTRLVGGTRVFMETSGTDNTYLYMAIILGEGEINDITEIRVDDKPVTWASDLADNTEVEVGSGDSNFYKDSASLIRVEPHFGSDSQTASTLLSTLSSWGTNHRLRGISYLALRFKWNQDAFSSIPKVQAVVQGRKVVTLAANLSEQTASFSSNPAFCLLDYLRNERYGKGIATADIDLQSFYDASQVCVTQVTPYSGGSDINIFDCNAVLDTSKKIIENVRTLLKGCRGYLPYTGGKYKLIIETTGSASITLTEDDIVGGYTLNSENKNDKYNRVICSFVNPDRNYQVDEVQFPPIDDSGLASADQHATMKTADGGFLLEGRFDFQTITSPYQAEEMAEIILRRSREALKLSVDVSGDGYDLAIGDILNITHASLGFSAKPFRVLAVSFNEDYTIGLTLVEYQATHYTWASKAQQTTVPTTTLPNPFVVQPPASVTLTDQLISYNDGTVIVALDVQIGASPDSFVSFYQVEYKLNSESDFKIHSQGSGLFQRVLNVIDQQVYDVRVKAVSSLGSSSTYVSAQRTIVGATDPISNVTDFSCNILGNEAHLSWEAVTDLDLAYYQVRYSTLTSGAEWQNSVSLIEKVSRPATSVTVPARVGSYLIKAVDKLGNFSLQATVIATNVTSIGNFNNVASATESPNFTGTKTNLTLASNLLRLTDLAQTGTYDFASVIDIGAIHTSRVTASLTQFSEDPTDLFDSKSGLFDAASGSFDGDAPANENAHLEIALSDDNSTFTAFRNFVIGDYTARYYKFRLVLISRDGATTPVISALSVTIDMEDRIQSGNDIASGAATKTVSFTNPFKTVNYAVGITGQGMATGDYFLVESKTINGFNVTFKNASDTVISRTFDFIAKGF
ncbi:phage tail protein [uncultured Mediterranean phage uvMED]|nr:phage tail protein [uncultured Mediterranean phage uvMED]